jgi:hypothetical protein
MKQIMLSFLLTAAFLPGTSFGAPDLSALEGKWLAKKANDEGQNYVQTIEIKKNKFKFQVGETEADGRLFAEGDVKVEKLGPFDCVKFSNIRGGASASDLVDVDDEYVAIYVLDGDTWRVATNFDKERDQKPSMDVYRKVKAAAAAGGTLVIDEVEMASTPQSATWYFCLDATVAGATKRFYQENKGYDKNKVTIPLGLEVPGAKAGQKCSFKMQLDDIDGDVCTEEVDDRSTGEFTISDRGSQSFKPEDNWSYTIRWHLK